MASDRGAGAELIISQHPVRKGHGLLAVLLSVNVWNDSVHTVRYSALTPGQRVVNWKEGHARTVRTVLMPY